VLGPFQGKVACTRIAIGRGVCGAAAARRETVVVKDVHAFPGHIACDTASQSEIVVPLLQAGGCWVFSISTVAIGAIRSRGRRRPQCGCRCVSAGFRTEPVRRLACHRS